MQRLSGIDSMFVALESPTNLFHVGAVAVFDPSTAPTGSAPPHEMLRRVVENRIHRIPPFTKTLVEVPGGVDHPWWVDTSDVDLSHHLRQGCLPPPGGESELAGYAAQVLSRPLDRKRPLWEIHTVEGLEGGLVAGVAKIHHSAVDGIAGTEVTAELMDLTPEVRLFDEEDQRPTSIPNPRPLRLVSSAIANAARRVVPAAKTLGQLPLTAAGIRSRNRKLDTIVPPSPFQSPRTPLAAPVGAHRTAALAQVDRNDVETVRAATGVKVNDVILALAGAALRLYLDERGELPERPLTSFVPISVRSASDTLLTGVNRLSGMLVSLATDVADPVVRLMTVSESSRSAKEQDQIIGPDLFTRLGEIAVPAIMAPAGRIARSLGLTRCYPPFSVVISSFPGPPLPLYCGGSELVAYHPFGPIVDGAVLNITAMSYRNRIGFGLLASADAVPDLDLIARTIPESLKQLKKALTAIRRD